MEGFPSSTQQHSGIPSFFPNDMLSTLVYLQLFFVYTFDFNFGDTVIRVFHAILSTCNHVWPWKPLIWKSCITPKHGFILWLFAHRKLLTRDRQPYVEDKRCRLCYLADEDLQHLFFECPASKRLWSMVRHWLGMHKLMGSHTAILKAFRSIYRGTSITSKARMTALASTIYHVWNLRNRALFEDELPDIDGTFRKIQIHGFVM